MDKSVQDIVIVGAGGLGRKVKWLIDRINMKQATWNILGFYDDTVASTPSGYPPILGKVSALLEVESPLAVVLALGDPAVRRTIYGRIRPNRLLTYPTLIDPDTVIATSTVTGKGVIAFPLSVLTADIRLGDFVHVNQGCSIGHDVVIGDYCTLYPSSVISGNVTIGRGCQLGANSCILQGLEVADRVFIGAGSVVTKNFFEQGATYAGLPARKIK